MNRLLNNVLRRDARKVMILVVLTILLFIINIFFIILPEYRKAIFAQKEESIRMLTLVAYSLVEDFVGLEQQGLMSREEAQEEAKEHVRLLRYGPEMKDYFWIVNTELGGVMHPYRPDIEDQNVILSADEDEDWNFFQEAVDIALTDGEGFVSYLWQWKDDSDRLEAKTSFIKLIEPWGWILGTGLYIDDVNTEIHRMTLLATFSSIIILIIIIGSMTYIVMNSAENAEISSAYTMLKKTQAQLVHSEKLAGIGQLAAGIAHEINTPIQFIGDNLRFIDESTQSIAMMLRECESRIGSSGDKPISQKDLELIRKAKEDADIDFLMEEIPAATKQSLEGIDRISAIVRAMKEFSHPGVDEKTAVDINHAIESTIIVARNEWKYYVDMHTEFDPTLPDVPCFPGEFNQAILNVIVNAAHAIRDVVGDSGEKGKIVISTKKLPDTVEIRISDTGPGIPRDIQSKIFEPFFTTKDVGKGTGQGLAISHNVIVEKHKGTISLESEMGKGATFIITLPLELMDNGEPNAIAT